VRRRYHGGVAGWRLEHTYTELPTLFHSHAAPAPVAAPRLGAFNAPLAASLGLDAESMARFRLVVPQRHDRIHVHRPTRGDVAPNQRDRDQDDGPGHHR